MEDDEGGHEYRNPEGEDYQPEDETPFGVTPHPDVKTENCENGPKKPNWIEKGTFFVLTFTLIAAATAAIEADRLARDTEAALSDARIASLTAHGDNVNAQNGSADATGQAQAAANKQHEDTVVALKKADAANVVALEAVESANRAWVAPRNVEFASPIQIGEPLRLRVHYENAGHEPAQDMAQNTEIVTRKTPPWSDDPKPLAAVIGPNHTCDSVHPQRGAYIVYPSSQFALGYTYDLPPSKFIANNDTTSGEQFVIARGCLVYKTFNKAKRSAFCFALRPQRKDQSFAQAIWGFCPIGNFAD